MTAEETAHTTINKMQKDAYIIKKKIKTIQVLWKILEGFCTIVQLWVFPNSKTENLYIYTPYFLYLHENMNLPVVKIRNDQLALNSCNITQFPIQTQGLVTTDYIGHIHYQDPNIYI